MPKRPDQVVRRPIPPSLSPLVLDLAPEENPLHIAFHSQSGEDGVDLPPLSPDVAEKSLCSLLSAGGRHGLPHQTTGGPPRSDLAAQNGMTSPEAALHDRWFNTSAADDSTSSIEFPQPVSAGGDALAESKQNTLPKPSKFLRRMSIIGRKGKNEAAASASPVPKTLRGQRSMPSMSRSVSNTVEPTQTIANRNLLKKRFSFSNLGDVFRRGKSATKSPEDAPPVPALPTGYQQKMHAGGSSKRRQEQAEIDRKETLAPKTRPAEDLAAPGGFIVPPRSSSVSTPNTIRDTESGMATALESVRLDLSRARGDQACDDNCRAADMSER